MTPPPSAPAGLFDPARHEALAAPPWSAAAAEVALRRIVDDANAAFRPDTFWPVHPLDDPEGPDEVRSALYDGAGGIVWALRHLEALGFGADASQRFDAAIESVVGRNRAAGRIQQALDFNSYLLGDSGLLLLQHRARPDPGVAERLHQAVESNLHHPALEMLWGSPGTLLAATHMSEATGDARWADLVERGARILFDAMTFDEELGAWVWRQDLYGRVRTFLGAGHGLVGNLYLVLRAAALLPPALVHDFMARGLQTLAASALRAEGCANWHPVVDPVAVVGRLPLVQDCHGAPGIVCRLATAPRSAAWDELLFAAGELTWRAGPLTKGPGLCHGTAGNGWAFLKLWTRSGDALWLERARAFAMHAIAQVERARKAHGAGRHSLWTGDIGVALYLRECLVGESRFPTLDVF